jgi:hypothetical protein
LKALARSDALGLGRLRVDPDGREVADFYALFGITVRPSDSGDFIFANANTAETLFLNGLSFGALLSSAGASVGPQGLAIGAGLVGACLRITVAVIFL